MLFSLLVSNTVDVTMHNNHQQHHMSTMSNDNTTTPNLGHQERRALYLGNALTEPRWLGGPNGEWESNTPPTAGPLTHPNGAKLASPRQDAQAKRSAVTFGHRTAAPRSGLLVRDRDLLDTTRELTVTA